MTDGTDVIRVFDAASLEVIAALRVTDGGKPVKLLNDVQYIDGKLWTNIWTSELLAVIDAESGIVQRYIDLRELLQPEDMTCNTQPDVLNGVAYDPSLKALVVTGKYWPKMYEIEVGEAPVLDCVEKTQEAFLDMNWLQRFLSRMNIE
mmetsp:Transcript_12757/g.39162  ORF Transcript_12757/g.39162 Transcript_12757/m.39162 type:complete len:148 (-) Transcript_12757:2557-3000(-)